MKSARIVTAMSLPILTVVALSGSAHAAGAPAAPDPARATSPTGAPADNTLCIYSTETTDKTNPGYTYTVAKQAYEIWTSKDFKDKYGHLSYSEQMRKLMYELNVSRHVFGHSWLVYFNKDGHFQREVAGGGQARYDTLSFQPQDPDGINGDGSAVDGMSINYTGYDINSPGKPMTEWDRPSRKQDQGNATLPRSARCVTLDDQQQANFKKEIDRRKEINEKYTLLPDWKFLATGGWAGQNARNCTTFALQVWDEVMKDTPTERLLPTVGQPAAELNRLGAEVRGDITQSTYSSWIPAFAGKWIYEKNGNRHNNDVVPRFAEDNIAPSPRS